MGIEGSVPCARADMLARMRMVDVVVLPRDVAAVAAGLAILAVLAVIVWTVTRTRNTRDVAGTLGSFGIVR
jgi:hypothetical protein